MLIAAEFFVKKVYFKCIKNSAAHRPPHIAGPDSIQRAMPLIEAIVFIYALPAMLRPQNGFRIGHEILKINSFYLIIRMV